jgi:hypothetical protein
MKQWIAAAIALPCVYLAGCAGNDTSPVALFGEFAGEWASQDYFVKNGDISLEVANDRSFTGTMSAPGSTEFQNGVLTGRFFEITDDVSFQVEFDNGQIYSFLGSADIMEGGIELDGTMQRVGAEGQVGIDLVPVQNVL